MGKQADMMLNGFLCASCGELLDGEEPGYPRKCNDCDPDKPKRRRRKNKTMKNQK